MKIDYAFLPMVKNYIINNMPHSGYKMVSKRLENQDIKMDNLSVRNEIRGLKSDCNIFVITECLLFMKENRVVIDKYCNEFLNCS